MNPRFSVLDLAPVRQGGTIAEAFRNTLDLAQHAEEWGFTRFWLAEHHNMMGIASAATSVLIGYVAGGTSRIRVGSGGDHVAKSRCPSDRGTVRDTGDTLSGATGPRSSRAAS